MTHMAPDVAHARPEPWTNRNPMKRVVKLGGRAQSADLLPALVARAWSESASALCIVHGGGDEVSALQRMLGREPRFAGGRRITTADDLELIRMVLSGAVNKRIVARLCAAGVRAVGVSGEDAALISAEPLGIAEFGHVGMPSCIDTELVESLWLGGFMPVISPLACSASSPSAALNVNGDDAAAALAVALIADELLLVADVEGVMDADGEVMRELDVDRARALIASGVAIGGMAAKLEAAHAALAGGVRTVRIADIQGLIQRERGTFVRLATAGVR